MDLTMIVLSLFVLCMVSAQNQLIDYNTLEELPPNTFIGNILNDAELNKKYDSFILPILRFSFLSQPSDQDALFDIEETTGIIRTAKRIDRDSICPGQELCTVSMDVAVGPGQYFQVIPVQIEILDINDNSPVFSEDEVSKIISESSPVDTTFIPLPIPEDVDSPANGLDQYEILPETEIFTIEQRQSLDGSVDLQLVLKRKLDREQMDFYQVRIIAYDRGISSRSGSMLVNITVEDSNDNHPEFTQVEYTAQIPENLHPEATIISVLAHDADITQNGEVVYGFSSRTQSTYGEIFGIHSDTGDVYLKDTVDAEEMKVYSLVVTATDKGSYSQMAQARVLVHVQDMNDNRPQITVNTLTPDQQGQISEISTIGTFVAHVSVIDKDSGNNGNVTCFTNDTNFDVHIMYTKRYKIITNNMFDREEQELYVLHITCMDHGSPSLHSIYDLTVSVLDVNDQSPLFNQTVYRASISEDSVLDTYVLQVNATDGDKGMNADILYSLQQQKPEYFRIIPESGVIRTAMNVDYEKIQNIEVQVIATDRGHPSNTGTATVIITVEDINDEPPAFIQEHYSFGIYENQDPDSEVGVVNAYDPDSEEFSMTEFRIQADDQFVLSAFRIDKNTGQITTKVQLDRESIAVYNLEVLAYNPGYDLTGTATVTVYVADDNDHAPDVDFPNSNNNTVTMSNLVPFGYVVTRIRAHDQDIGNNAHLVYALIQGNEDGLFDMDGTTGAITVRADLSLVPNRTYNLSVEIMDNGDKPQTVITTIHVVIDSTMPYLMHGGLEQENTNDDSGTNSMIVIIVGCLSGAVIVALIVAILAIRMQDIRRKEDQNYNCRTEAQKMLHGGSLDGSQSPIHKNSLTKNPYNSSSTYSKSGSNVINNPRTNNCSLHPVPETSPQNVSFLEAGSLSNTGSAEGRTAPSWNTQNNTQKQNCRSPGSANQGHCQASHGHHQSTRDPPALDSFSLPHSEIGYAGHNPYSHHGDQQTHIFPAHSAAINKPHLSPLSQDIQLQHVPWSNRPTPLDHDNESACSGEMSNTDSGRGASEEGEHGHNHHHSNQPGNRQSDISDSETQERMNKVGCHGNTGAVKDVKNNLNKTTSQNKPSIKVLDVPCKKHPSGPQNTNSFAANIINGSPDEKMGTPNKSSVNGYMGTHSSLPGWESVPIGGRKKPPRPPRTDSLRKAPLNHSFTSNTESQYGSTAEIGDDASSSTSGSYVVDQEVLAMDNYSPSHAINVPIQASNV